MNKKRKKMKYYDQDEKELIESIESGELKTLAKKEKEKLTQLLTFAANNNTKKKRSINIRISEADLRKIKAQAIEKGVSYQTLIGMFLKQGLKKNSDTTYSA